MSINTFDPVLEQDEVEETDCSHCLTTYVVDGNDYCPDCDGHIHHCDWCSNAYHDENDELFRTGQDETICASCYEDHASSCPQCGEVYHVDEFEPVIGGYGTEHYCSDCRGRYAHWCDSCSQYEMDDHDCGQASQHLRSYRGNPPLKFFGSDDPKAAYLGLELECVANGSSIDETIEAWWSVLGDQRFFFKEDGSLPTGDSMEIVSQPHTLSAWAGMKPNIDRILRSMRSDGWRSWDNSDCGIHVHVSTAAFRNDAHLLRFAQLFYKNSMSMQKFAGRSSERWAAFDNVSRQVFKDIKRRKASGCGAGARYVAVNMSNTSTIEIRIFRGTLNTERVYADLELVHAALEYTRDLTVKDVSFGALKFDCFAMWAAKNGSYEHMTSLINTKRIHGFDTQA